MLLILPMPWSKVMWMILNGIFIEAHPDIDGYEWID
jgi:hypothetical protein